MALKVVVSIDTEEDNWVPTRTNLTVENIRELPKMHAFLQHLGAHPTYFLAHQVLATAWTHEILRDIVSVGGTEMATHLHPWNTPPFREEFTPQHTMLKNLSPALQAEKLTTVTNAMRQLFGRQPTAFRAGRFGFGAGTVGALIDSGYTVDSSVTPYLSWEATDHGANFVGAPSRVYRLRRDSDPRCESADGAIIEVPISVGYNRRNFEACNAFERAAAGVPQRLFRLQGIAARMGVVRRIIMSPETNSAGDMLQLARRSLERGADYLQVFWHSPSLVPGLSEFARDTHGVNRLYDRVAGFLEGLQAMTSVRFMTVSDLARGYITEQGATVGDVD